MTHLATHPTAIEHAATTEIIAAQHWRDLTACVAETWRVTGSERRLYRGYVRRAIRSWRYAEARRVEAFAAAHRTVRRACEDLEPDPDEARDRQMDRDREEREWHTIQR